MMMTPSFQKKNDDDVTRTFPCSPSLSDPTNQRPPMVWNKVLVKEFCRIGFQQDFFSRVAL